MLHGIDVSYAQGLYDMEADTSPLVFMKMSGFYYGSKTPYYDNQAARNYQNAIRTGKLPGMYHFAGGANPTVEADFFVGACSPLAENDVLILDYELTADMEPPADPAEWCWQFVSRVHDRTGVWPLFYTYRAMLNDYKFDKVLEKCGLWIADYTVSPDADVPTNGRSYLAHQFQGSPLDTNALFISLETLKKYGWHGIQPQPDPPAPVPPTPVPEPEPVPLPAPLPPGTNIDGVIPPPHQPNPVPVNTPLPPVVVTTPPVTTKEHAWDVLVRSIKTFVAAYASFVSAGGLNILHTSTLSELKLSSIAAIITAVWNTVLKFRQTTV